MRLKIYVRFWRFWLEFQFNFGISLPWKYFYFTWKCIHIIPILITKSHVLILGISELCYISHIRKYETCKIVIWKWISEWLSCKGQVIFPMIIAMAIAKTVIGHADYQTYIKYMCIRQLFGLILTKNPLVYWQAKTPIVTWQIWFLLIFMKYTEYPI